MELTKIERIILINQYEILKRLDVKNSGDYDNYVKILTEGFTYLYSNIGEFISDEVSEDKGAFVFEVLSLYRQIENFKHDNPDDKEISDHIYGVFQGFDGNNENEYYSFTNFVINDQNLFAEQKTYTNETDSFNSHSPMVGIYKKMISLWNEKGKKVNNRDDIISILNS